MTHREVYFLIGMLVGAIGMVMLARGYESKAGLIECYVDGGGYVANLTIRGKGFDRQTPDEVTRRIYEAVCRTWGA